MAELNRSLSLPLLVLYGLGTILGAGIYVLVGKVAAEAGGLAPLSFLAAAAVALLSSFAYAELAARYPLAAGEAVYIDRAFSRRWLTMLVGWAVVTTGVVSAATLTRGFVGYAAIFIDLPDWLVMSGLVAGMAVLTAWGITASAGTAAAITVIECAGIGLVLWMTRDDLLQLPVHWQALLVPRASPAEWLGVGSGAVLAFYAYIGFEDMVNLGEEVKNPQRALPAAIFAALAFATLLYLAVAGVAVLGLPLEVLAASDAPLTELVEQRGGSPVMISLISLVAVLNGALVQIIMASRVIYGMGRQGAAPAPLAVINTTTRTPVTATLSVAAVCWAFALALDLVLLAQLTSIIILLIFALVNAAAAMVKKRDPHPQGVRCYPIALPYIGFGLCALLVVLQLLFWIG